MKHLFSPIIIILLCLVACTEVCDHGVVLPHSSQSVVGTWYEEEENEEIRLSPSNTLYDKYSNTRRSGEIEGRYEFDKENMRLTYTYEFAGHMQFADWKVTDLTEFSFTISSENVGAHRLERVVETLTLEVGESASLSFFEANPEYSLVSMETTSRIVSIDSSSQIIAACGEKGTAYIKLNTNNGIAWAKVVVGDECVDLWYDYVSFIGKDYRYMTSVLGSPSINGEDGYSFGYSVPLHDLISEVDFFMNSSTGLIEEIGIALRHPSPIAQIQSYMTAHYYPTDLVGNGDSYTTSPTLAESIALVKYNKDQSVVWITDASFYILPDYAGDLGKTQDEIVAKYGELMFGYPLYDVLNYYGGSVYFMISETTGAVTAVMFSMIPDHNAPSVHQILSSTYNHYKTDETNTKFAYRDAGEDDSTIMVIYDAEQATITWFDLINYGK